MNRSLSEKPLQRKVEKRTALLPSPLSFHDPFVSIDGIPALFLTSDKNARVSETPFRSKASQSKETKIDFDAPQRITCCAFSDDGSRLASGRNSGAAEIWDVHRGILHDARQLHTSPICSIIFRESSNTIVMTVDRMGSVLEWSFDRQSHVSRMDCASQWREDGDIKSIIQKPKFFKRGNVVVFPIKEIMTDKSYGQHLKMKLMVIDTRTMHLGSDTKILEASIKERDVVTRLEMSPDGKGLLVGFTDTNVEQGYVMLWPDMELYPDKSVFLSKGTLGNWSPDNRKVVTWTVPEDPFPQVNDACCAFLWDIESLRHRIIHSDVGNLGYSELKNPSGKNVLWCCFVPDADGKEQLVMCVLSTKLKLIFWDTQSHHLTHVIDTSWFSDQATNGDDWL